MNICILCRNIHKDLGGIETFVREFSYALAQDGHTIHIIAQNRGKLYREPLHPNIKMHDITLSEKPFFGYWYLDSFVPLEELRFAFAASAKVNEIAKTEHIDIVEIMDYFRQGVGLAINGRHPLFLRLHGWMFNKPGYWVFNKKDLSIKERCQRWFMQICLNNADGIAAVSDSFGKYAATVWKIPAGRLSVLPNAVDVKKYHPGNLSRETAIIFSSRMLKNKGVVVFVDALSKIFKKFPDLKVYFAGSDQRWDDDKIMAKEYIEKRLPAKNLVFLGAIPADQVIAYYQKCTISVLPSLYEPFGLSALEAMACGCAIIATKSGGPPEFIIDGEDGLLIESTDANALANAIERFLTDDRLRESCTQNAIRKANEHFTYKNLVNQSLEAYNLAIDHFKQRRKKRN